MGLWGEEFEITPEKIQAKKIKDKLAGKTTEQILKSKITPVKMKIDLITQNVYKVLGHYKDIITLIKTREELHSYIDTALENDIIVIDTETNNSLDPLTCQLMGVCLYTPSLKTAYIPINHVNVDTDERLDWQLTEKDIKEELQRVIDNNIKEVFHNFQFDYQVLKCTCDLDMVLYWDTYGGARMINENEPSAGLKQQYINKIDPDQEKYSIERLFEGLPYAIFDPEIFCYYAAIDAYMTYKLYLWQVEKFKSPERAGNYKIFREVEIPLESILSRMTLRGISLDEVYTENLSKKYHKLSEEANEKIEKELHKYDNQILQWRLSPEANTKTLKADGKYTKSKNEQLEDPIKLESPTQLAILLYDILRMPSPDPKNPRGTGVEELKSLAESTGSELCKLMLEKRNLDKLISAFIDKMPKAANPKDKKIHPSFNGYGTDTGRMASSNPSLQQIPARNNEIRAMFCAQKGGDEVIDIKDELELEPYDEIEIKDKGWIKVKELQIDDIIIGKEKDCKVDNITYKSNYNTYKILVSEL